MKIMRGGHNRGGARSQGMRGVRLGGYAKYSSGYILGNSLAGRHNNTGALKANSSRNFVSRDTGH